MMLGNILDVIQTLVIVGGALWTYYRFFHEGEHKERIEFDIDCDFFGPQTDAYIAAFRIHAINRGRIEHKFDEIRLRVLGIKEKGKIKEWKGHEPLAEFPEKQFPTVNIIPIDYYFVRPGVREQFSYAAVLPSTWKYAIAKATFMYKTHELHSTERVFEIKAGKDKSSQF